MHSYCEPLDCHRQRPQRGALLAIDYWLLSTDYFSSPVPLMDVLADGVAQLRGLLFGEGAGGDAPLLEADDGDAAVHLEVEGESAAVLQLEDERGRDAGRAV